MTHQSHQVATATVSATVAAEAMGGFSRPRWRADATPERVAEVESARERGLWWTHTHSVGGRKLTLLWGEVTQCFWLDDEPSLRWAWLGYQPDEVIEAEYTSASSGATLRWTATSNGEGELEYIAPATNPAYRGAYYRAWCKAARLDPEVDYCRPKWEGQPEGDPWEELELALR